MAQRKLDAASSSATYQNITSTDEFPYDENILGWLQNIKRAWSSWKKSATISQMLHNCYSNASNPYYCALYLMFNSGDMYYAKPSTLSYTVMEELQKWLNQYGPDNFSSCLADPNLKMKAFNIVTKQHNLSLMRLVFSIFKLADIRDIFLDDIHELLKTNQYKEVSYVVSALGLYDKFNVEDFLVPLVLQDKLSVIEEYLFTCPSQQTELVSYLDRLLGSGNTFCEVERIAMRLEVPDPKYEKFNYKPLSKLISRLSKKYHIPLSFCPNLERKRKEGALHFLLTKKYIENSIGGDSWRELIGDAVGSSENLQKELVISLTQYGDDYEALHWARVYNIPYEDVPFNIKEIWNTEPNSPPDNAYSTTPNTAVPENWDNDTQTKDDCHKFPLPIQHIHLIDSEDRLRWLINEQLNGVNIIGFDAEWKPSFVGTKTSKLALLQIATLVNVYIIDLVALDTKSHWWHKLGQDLFGNENILKLGFGIEGDVMMMKQCLSLGDINFKGKGYIDLAVLWKKLVNDWSIKFPHTQSNYSISPEGLSKLVYLCLGQKLDKDDQFSDWERRPLRETQKVYAALDAYCLLEVYEVLQNCCMKQDIPFYEVCVETMVSMNKKTTKSRSERRHQNNELIPLPPSPNVDPVPVSWLRVVCQNGLEGLGKQLRMCGVDAVLLPHMSSHDDCLKAARLDNRIIVTRGSVYNRLYRNVPPGHCFRVETNSSETQVLEVLEYYNVVVKDTDIFSRCMVCNSDNFIKLESKVIRELAIVNQQAKSLPVTPYLKSSMDYVEKAMIDMENRFLSDDEDDYGVVAVPGPAVDKPPCNPEVNNVVRMHNCQTQSGAHIKVEDIPVDVIDKTPFFHVCETCGKCYWDGTHLRNTLHGRLEKVIKKSSGSGSSNRYHK